MEENFPYNMTSEELVNSLKNLMEEFNKPALTGGEKETISRKIQLGYSHLTTLNLQHSLAELQAHKEILEKSVQNNKITSRNNKTLSWILIALAIFTLIGQLIPNNRSVVENGNLIFNRLDSTNLLLENSLDSLNIMIQQNDSSILMSNKHFIQIGQIEKTINRINNKLNN